MSRCLGVDGCRAGWVGRASDGRFYVEASMAALVAAAEADGPVDVLGIDIPIGLAEASRRQCDLLAKKLLGPLSSSVFLTPVRAAVEAPTFEAANAANKALTGHGVSKQAFALFPKILDVDRWIRGAGAARRVVEVHPEVTFLSMDGRVLPRKKTWAGTAQRHGLLAEAGLAPGADIGPAGLAGADDVLDACAALWTAQRCAHGEARPMPDPPEPVTCGMTAAIWA